MIRIIWITADKVKAFTIYPPVVRLERCNLVAIVFNVSISRANPAMDLLTSGLKDKMYCSKAVCNLDNIRSPFRTELMLDIPVAPCMLVIHILSCSSGNTCAAWNPSQKHAAVSLFDCPAMTHLPSLSRTPWQHKSSWLEVE